jgi:hypothetical protein
MLVIYVQIQAFGTLVKISYILKTLLHITQILDINALKAEGIILIFLFINISVN